MNRILTSASAAALLLAGPTACSDSKTSSSTDDAAKPAATHGSPAKANRTTTPAKAGTSGAPTKKLPTSQARKQAAMILKKEDQDFRDFLSKGETVTGTADFTAWYQKAIVGLDMKQTAFNKADAYFTADNEPTDLLEQ